MVAWPHPGAGQHDLRPARPATNSPGAAYICVHGASGWATKPTAMLSDPTATPGDGFGYPEAVPGQTAVIGAWSWNSGLGSASIYKA
jgi:hypothetical protein